MIIILHRSLNKSPNRAMCTSLSHVDETGSCRLLIVLCDGLEESAFNCDLLTCVWPQHDCHGGWTLDRKILSIKRRSVALLKGNERGKSKNKLTSTLKTMCNYFLLLSVVKPKSTLFFALNAGSLRHRIFVLLLINAE